MKGRTGIEGLQKLVACLAAGTLLLILWAASAAPLPEPPAPAPVPAATSVAAGTPVVEPVPTPPGLPPRPGGELLFECRTALCLLDLSANQLHRIEPPAADQRYRLPRWSPAGTHFATLAGSEAADQPAELLVFTAQGSIMGRAELGTGYLHRQASLHWSPQARWLVFSAPQAAGPDQQPGAMAHLLFTPPAGDVSHTMLAPVFEPLLADLQQPKLAWSPDGRWLAFVRQAQIWVFDSQTGAQVAIAEGSDPTWGPGPGTITYVNQAATGLVLHDLQSRQQRLLLDVDQILHSEHFWAAEPAPQQLVLSRPLWSPSGAHLAFRAAGQAEPGWSSYLPAMLFTMTADGLQLARWPDPDNPETAAPVWSPTGQHLIYPFWLIGGQRYHRDTPQPPGSAGFSYRCATGLMLVDVLAESYHEAICGTTATGQHAFGDWSPDGRSFATSSGAAVALLSTSRPAQPAIIPAPRPAQIQWRPQQRSGAAPAQAASSAATGCQVTRPVLPQTPPSSLMMTASNWYGSAAFWVVLPPQGSFTLARRGAALEPVSFGWWGSSPGALAISGRRLDAPAPALRAVIAADPGAGGFQASELYFPTPGCWEISGVLLDQAVRFTVEVRERQ